MAHQVNQIFYACQFPLFVFPSPSNLEWVNRIDPRNHLIPHAAQVDFYNKNPQVFNYRVDWVQNELKQSGDKIEHIQTKICPNVLKGAQYCFPACTFVHNLPFLWALEIHRSKVPATDAKKQPPPAKDPTPKQIELPGQFKPIPIWTNPLPSLKINTHVEQPTQELNKESAEDEWRMIMEDIQRYGANNPLTEESNE